MTPARVLHLGKRSGVRFESPDDEFMWIHKERRIAFIANPRTGSRELGYGIFKVRGFERWMGHHGVPWSGEYGRKGNAKREGDHWWWFQEDLLNWHFYAARRNHFEVFHSIGRAALGNKGPTVEGFEKYIWNHPALYRNQHILFPVFFEIATCQAFRFEHLRDDVDAMLRREGLPPLKPDEGHRKDSNYVTVQKPRGEKYQTYLPVDCRLWIEEMYAAEMAQYGYRWEE